MAEAQSATGWNGGTIRDGAICVLAGNPGVMTLDGTNTWLVYAPGEDRAVAIDPGPDDDMHLHAVLHAARQHGLQIVQVLLTHGHLDHSAGARRFAELTGSAVRAVSSEFTTGAAPLVPGEVVEAGSLQLHVVPAPGHTGDSVCFSAPALRALFTGDTVLGRGTTVVAHPDGQLGPYLASLARLRDLAELTGVELILPGHGPVVSQPLQVLDGYIAHRKARLEQVREAVAAGAHSAREVVERVYADVDRSLWPAAELSVEAQLAYLGPE